MTSRPASAAPWLRDRLWFFSGYQHLRDYDSQPGTDPDLPRKYEQDKIFAKLTWRLAPGWQLVQSFHDEFWSNPETPSATKPLDATQRLDASVPAMNLGHLMHTASANTVWDVRVGWFRFTQDTSPTSGDPKIANRIDLPENVWSGGPQQIGTVRQSSHDGQGDPQPLSGRVVRRGSRVENGRASRPGRASRGRRPSDRCELCLHKWRVDAAHAAGTRQFGRPVRHGRRVRERRLQLGDRVAINPGLRFDHSRAISQDVPEFDKLVQETGRIIEGRGTVDTWNIVSPRLGVVIKLDASGRTMLRANAGRFSQGMLTGEIAAIHPGRTRNTIIREPSGIRARA